MEDESDANTTEETISALVPIVQAMIDTKGPAPALMSLMFMTCNLAKECGLDKGSTCELLGDVMSQDEQ